MNFRNLTFIGFHLLWGIAVSRSKTITYYWGVFVLIAGVIDILANANKGNRAALWAGYFMGMEVFLRMTSTAFFWEIGKYGMVLLIGAGLISDRLEKPKPYSYLLYFLLLLPSILVIDFPTFDIGQQAISFNLSGPFSLAVAAFYFYKRPISSFELKNLMLAILLPLTAMLVYIILSTPNLETVRFTTQSNFTTSAGFGPNQVSTMLGVGALLTGISIFYRIAVTGSYIGDIILFVGFTLRGLITFSRGGLVSAILSLGLMVVFYILFASKGRGWLAYTLLFFLVVAGTSYAVWDYANEATNDMLKYRYLGINPVNMKEQDITSRRWEILLSELDAFQQEPVFGIGPGMEKYDQTLEVKSANSHSEITRLFAEHGLFGIVSMLILLIVPIQFIRRMPAGLRPIAIAFFSLSILTMLHSAMRLAMPGFLYGLSMILPLQANKRVNRIQDVQDRRDFLPQSREGARVC